nr:MAG TPA: hypothetical protein [Caudoviricetes sp.]
MLTSSLAMYRSPKNSTTPLALTGRYDLIASGMKPIRFKCTIR